MSPRRLLLALSLLTLSGCSTVPQSAPAQIPPPPVALVSRCQSPGDLPAEATAQALSEWVMAWIGTAGCERAKRQALLESWPR